MSFYKHYSFDLWMTLIKSNPLFKPARAAYFCNNFNPYKKTMEEVTSVFKRIDLVCNAINEKTGRSIDAEEMYLMVIAELGNYSHSFNDIDLMALYEAMDNLVFQYLPVVFCNRTRHVLDTLRKNHSMNALSNTAFIKGSTLRRVLKEIGLSDYFDFQLYSDETGMSKPNKQLYQLMLDHVNKINRTIDITEIVHVGDNLKADIQGANAAGISSFLINTNDQTILNLLN